MGQATSTVLEDTPEVRMTEWRFLPGAATGFHVHALDYSIVYLTGGRLRAVGPSADVVVDVHPGMAYFRKAGVAHDVTNVGSGEVVLVETELKGAVRSGT